MLENQAHYRYGSFDFGALERVIAENLNSVAAYRARDVLSFSTADERAVADLFNEFLEALKIADGKSAGKKSPVAVAEAMHVLAPSFFPLWDDKIAAAYGCRYSAHPAGAYLRQGEAVATTAANVSARQLSAISSPTGQENGHTHCDPPTRCD